MTTPEPSVGPATDAPGSNVRLGGVGLLVTGVVLALSGFLPWFQSSIGSSPKHDVNGFRKGEWLLSVPGGWVALIGGLLLAGIGVAMIAPRRVPWRLPTLVLAPVVGAVTCVWIVADRFHLHNEVRSDLEAAVAKAVAAQPAQAKQAQALLDSAHFTDRYGLWLAILASAAATAIGAVVLRRSRRVATSASAEA